MIEDIIKQKRKSWKALQSLRKRGNSTETTNSPEPVKSEQAFQETCTCPKCKTVSPVQVMKDTFQVCPSCGFYLPLGAQERMDLVCDKNSFRELFAEIVTADPLYFPGYEEKLAANRDKTGLNCAFLAGVGRIRKKRVCLGVLDGRFLMGSMGTAVGEKITRLCEYADKKHLPLIIFSASGGARMQEGLFSLMQMAKTAAAVEKFKQDGGLFISYLTNPTTGGVSASYASLGDIILAEPDALICFAGPRVIEQTIGQKLPEGFQHAEFLLEHGMIDKIVERKNMRGVLAQLLHLHEV